jgi:DNA polymerase-4
MPIPPRVILHVDMDAFFVSVELRRRPELRGKPVVVGGTGPRGVVAAASYEARQFGVHSALPSAVARRRCPHAVFLPGDHALYGEVSAQVRDIFDRYTPRVEPLALDEAFLDVSGATRLFGDGTLIAGRIRADVRAELDLGCSVGVAPNKFLAKLASVAAKPKATPERVLPGCGVVEVMPGQELEFLHPLPVSRLWGVGPVTFARLERLGIRTVGDLAVLDEGTLSAALGATQAAHLHALAWGRDERPVEIDRDAKSIGHEETYPRDLVDVADLERELVRLADAVASRLRGQGVAARTANLKVRFAGFRTVTRSVTVPDPIETGPALVAVLGPILRAMEVSEGVRLLGVSGSNLVAPTQQLNLLADTESPLRAAGAIDQIRERFGPAAIGPASAVGPRGVDVVRKGARQWGPDQPSDDPGPRTR